MKVKGALNRGLSYGGRTLVNYNCKLGCVVQYIFDETSKSFKLWVLEDVEKQEWSERIYLLPGLWKDVVGNAKVRFVGVTRKNEIVFSPLYPTYHFYLY